MLRLGEAACFFGSDAMQDNVKNGEPRVEGFGQVRRHRHSVSGLIGSIGCDKNVLDHDTLLHF
jgi:hypothetical protein